MLGNTFVRYNASKVEYHGVSLGIIGAQFDQNLCGLLPHGLYLVLYLGAQRLRAPIPADTVTLLSTCALVWLSRSLRGPSGLGGKDQMGVPHSGQGD